MRLGDMNTARMLGPGDLSSYNDPQFAKDGPEPCEVCDDEGCAICENDDPNEDDPWFGREEDYEPDLSWADE